jgi:WD40 repeat protein
MAAHGSTHPWFLPAVADKVGCCTAVLCVLCCAVQGVLGMSWCQQDHSLLLSCSKDNRTICWDVNSTDVICELPASEHYNFEVQWCSTAPGVFATASFDGKVALHSLLSCTEQAAVESFNADFTVSKSSTGEGSSHVVVPCDPVRRHAPVFACYLCFVSGAERVTSI